MSDTFRFETFVDVHGSIFNEYLSSVTAKLSREDKEYQALQAKIEGIYGKYPKVLGVFDSETEMQAVYFRGCYDSVGYLKKAGIL